MAERDFWASAFSGVSWPRESTRKRAFTAGSILAPGVVVGDPLQLVVRGVVELLHRPVQRVLAAVEKDGGRLGHARLLPRLLERADLRRVLPGVDGLLHLGGG